MSETQAWIVCERYRGGVTGYVVYASGINIGPFSCLAEAEEWARAWFGKNVKLHRMFEEDTQ